ncbi:MAG: CHAT domain-containing protein [Planctomycetes bacterium]|nr:CHAT domain-containing protein [Planctomycetota bacterium]
MKQATLALALLVGLAATVRAEDAPSSPPAAPPVPAAPSPSKPPPPPTPEQAADAVLVAIAAKDDATLKALASKDAPDPWLVADELIRREQHDAAEAFARAAPRVDTEALPAYVASRRGKPDDPSRRARIAKANAPFAAGDAAGALAALGAPETAAIEDVVGVRLAMGRAVALRALVRFDDSLTAYRAAGEAAETMGWLARATRVHLDAGVTDYRRSAFASAADAWRRALALAERRGDRAGAADALGDLGMVHVELGDYAKAKSAFERALAAKEALGNKAGAAATLGNLASVHYALGELETACAVFQRALAALEAAGDVAGAASTMGNLGLVYAELGDYPQALGFHERALAAKAATGDRAGAALTLANIAAVHRMLGRPATALPLLQRALAEQAALGDRAGAAVTQSTLGNVHHALGEHAKALSALERALAAKEALGDRAGAALTLGNLGAVRFAIGDYAQALTSWERALAVQEALGDKAGAAVTLGNVAQAHRVAGDLEGALSVLERALAARQALGNEVWAAETLGAIGAVHLERGDADRARSFFERALAAQEALGARAAAAATRGNLGNAHLARGDVAKALAAYDRALAAQEELGDRAAAVRSLGNLATAHLRLGDGGKAVAFARRAVVALAQSVTGLSAEEGAAAREPDSFVYDVGARAALGLGDTAELLYFVEHGRAGALLEGLAAREALASVAVPDALRDAEVRARAAETRAAAALLAAVERGDLAATRARRADLDAAQAQVGNVVARIQREAVAGASLVHPEAATLDELRATLEAGDALVLYASSEEVAAALVVERGGARIVTLGPRAPIEAAADAVADALADDEREPAAPLAALADLVVKPLALGEGTKRVLVSPAGTLSYVPFAALIPDRTVVYVPSGTTYRLLREEEALRGDGVLALGDPDYATKVDERALAVNRGATGKLVRLPATRDEALAVGTETLLGADATEAGLRKALAGRKRWRAVHLACHGLVNAERPALSSLAITAAGDDDGFLTCLDVFRMKVPADLVVLSACETGKGKVVKGEGIVGLTRAFMFAGSPRVLCSLWKVDDAATSALMTKFYELWNPRTGSKGLGTAEALRRAQEHVRSQEKWKHPYYWAAWVLWGLPS